MLYHDCGARLEKKTVHHSPSTCVKLDLKRHPDFDIILYNNMIQDIIFNINIHMYIIYMSPAPGFPVPPPQWYGPPGPCPGGGGVRAFTTISTIAIIIITPTAPTTPRAPPTTTTTANAAATTDYCCCCCCGYCCCYYYDYYYILLYTMSIFTSTSTSTSTFKPNYVCTHACPHHRPQGGEDTLEGEIETWVIAPTQWTC